MYRSKATIATFFGLIALCIVPSVVYGQVQVPDTVYLWTTGNESKDAMMASLAGIVNRTAGEVMLVSNGYSVSESVMGPELPDPIFWLNQLEAQYPQVQHQRQYDPVWYINKYKNRFNGYVLYDTSVNPHSANIATSIAGVTDSLIVNPSTLHYATSAGLTQTADARSMTYASTYSQYGSQFNKNLLFNRDPNPGPRPDWGPQPAPLSTSHFSRDLAVKEKAFMAYQPPAMDTYLANQNHQGRVLGWGPDETHLFTRASQANQMVTPASWLWSSSATSAWEVPLAQQQTHTPVDVATAPGKHYVAFVMSDGDSVDWLTTSKAIHPSYFGSPYRGNFDMNWGLSPALAEINPVAFNYYYNNASTGANKDFFVTDGGPGMVFPSQYPDITGLATATGDAMETVDQTVLSVLDRNYNLSKLYPLLDESQVMGMMFKSQDGGYFNSYEPPGTIDWHNGKPIVSIRYSLWPGYDTALSIANALNSSTHKDPLNDQASYSIVHINPYYVLGPDGTGSGDPMSDLNWLVQQLNSSVDVVTLEELMIHLRNNFGTPVLALGAPVPEPGALVMLIGLGGMALLGRLLRRRSCPNGNS